MTQNKPEITLCCQCQKLLIEDEIVRYRNSGIWLAWCWPCFKHEHLKNLTRLQEEK